MNCDESRHRALAGSADPAHVESCPACRRFADDVERLERLIQDAREEPPEPVWSRIRPIAARPRQRGWRRLLGAAAAAAAVLVGIALRPAPPVSTPARPTPPAAARQTRAHPTARAVADFSGRRLDADLDSTRAEIDWLDQDIRKF